MIKREDYDRNKALQYIFKLTAEEFQNLWERKLL